MKEVRSYEFYDFFGDDLPASAPLAAIELRVKDQRSAPYNSVRCSSALCSVAASA